MTLRSRDVLYEKTKTIKRYNSFRPVYIRHASRCLCAFPVEFSLQLCNRKRSRAVGRGKSTAKLLKLENKNEILHTSPAGRCACIWVAAVGITAAAV